MILPPRALLLALLLLLTIGVLITPVSAQCVSNTSTMGAYTVVSFNYTGTCTWIVPAGVTSIDLFLVGGGGSGATNFGGGGGGGNTTNKTGVSVTPSDSWEVSVGPGGAAVGPSSAGVSGTNTSLSKGGILYNAIGGLGGPIYPSMGGGAGGSGGGAAAFSTGGANHPGGNGGSNGANGGNAQDCDDTWKYGGSGQGSTTRAFGELAGDLYAGGGGGSSYEAAAGAGGAGGGGAGASGGADNGVAGTPDTGGGGGGASASGTGWSGAGGSGVVILRYIISPPPVAAFSCTPTTGTINFDTVCTDASTNTPTSWSWNVENGTVPKTSTLKNPIFNMTYPGTYNVNLSATNAGGTDWENKTAYLTANPPPPVAAFTGTPTSGTRPLSVVFTDESTNTPTSWNWSAGDGANVSALQNPTFVYTVAGSYDVNLTACNAGGCDVELKAAYITVTDPAPPPPPPPPPGCSWLNVSLYKAASVSRIDNESFFNMVVGDGTDLNLPVYTGVEANVATYPNEFVRLDRTVLVFDTSGIPAGYEMIYYAEAVYYFDLCQVPMGEFYVGLSGGNVTDPDNIVAGDYQGVDGGVLTSWWTATVGCDETVRFVLTEDGRDYINTAGNTTLFTRMRDDIDGVFHGIWAAEALDNVRQRTDLETHWLNISYCLPPEPDITPDYQDPFSPVPWPQLLGDNLIWIAAGVLIIFILVRK